MSPEKLSPAERKTVLCAIYVLWAVLGRKEVLRAKIAGNSGPGIESDVGRQVARRQKRLRFSV